MSNNTDLLDMKKGENKKYIEGFKRFQVRISTTTKFKIFNLLKSLANNFCLNNTMII